MDIRCCICNRLLSFTDYDLRAHIWLSSINSPFFWISSSVSVSNLRYSLGHLLARARGHFSHSRRIDHPLFVATPYARWCKPNDAQMRLRLRLRPNKLLCTSKQKTKKSINKNNTRAKIRHAIFLSIKYVYIRSRFNYIFE